VSSGGDGEETKRKALRACVVGEFGKQSKAILFFPKKIK